MKKQTSAQDYRNYRWFFTSNKVLVVGGKSDSQNEAVIRNFLKPSYTILHTSLPGSPFMVIQSNKPTKKDLEETAIICACFSHQWKLGEKKIEVDIFKGEEVYKTKSMKIGTFGVKANKNTMIVKPEIVLVIQKGKLRAVTKTTKEKILIEVKQGKLTKEEAADKIAIKIKNKFHFPVTREEIMQAIPSGKLSVR